MNSLCRRRRPTACLPRIALLPALFLSAILFAEDEFPGVESLMSAKEFNASGLDKLSPEELDALNRWLIGYTVGEAPVIRRENPEVRKAEKDFKVEATVTPAFRGWSGETTFRLDNGQVWKQRLDGRFSYSGGDHRVRIEKNFMGFFRLRHIASGKAVGVTRIN